MKTFLALFFSFTLFTATAQPSPIYVDFTSLGIDTVDITLENDPAGLALNGITLGYDNFGSSPDFASADQIGIYGTTYGALVFNFTSPETALNYDFSVLSTTGPDANALVVLFFDAGNLSDVVTIPGVYTPYDFDDARGQIDGSLTYTGPTFDQAVSYFSPVQSEPEEDLYYFTVGNLSYTPAPEPASWLLVTLGLGGLLVKGRKSVT
ncbi:MAG: PEP-CTERM sorting domain-containing protein [Verrucomicrobiia bacterium]